MSSAGERGQAMLALLVAATLATVIGVSLVGLMNTDMSHAAIQYAASPSCFIAQAALEEAVAHVYAAADPAAGVTAPYGDGRFTYWVDAGPAAGCGAGLKTLEAEGQVEALGRFIPARVQACAAPGVPFLAGVSRVEFQEASRTYLAPYDVGTPGGGANLGSFTEINFADTNVRLNALSEEAADTVTVRDGTSPDYTLFGFSTHPDYNSFSADPTPWILGTFGDLIEAQPTTGAIPNPCGTPHACVTVGRDITDIAGGPGPWRQPSPACLREAPESSDRPPLSFDPALFQRQAEQNRANADLNKLAGLTGKNDSHYSLDEIYWVLSYLVLHSGQYLQGAVYVDGTLNVPVNINPGGPSGSVTLAVGGDLIIHNGRTLTNRHDLTVVEGRRTPGILVLAAPELSSTPTPVCGGQDVNGSGRLVMCEGSGLVVDGLVYTQDGMVVLPRASVDQVGAMHHNNRSTPNPGFTTRDATVVVRFDPLALSTFGKGITMLSWHEVGRPQYLPAERITEVWHLVLR